MANSPWFCWGVAAVGLCTATPLFAQDIEADDFTLHYDAVPLDPNVYQFQYDDKLLPEPSDFTLANYAVLSDNVGQRWALVTVKNTSSGARIVTEKNIVATFASGERSYPLDFRERIKGHEVRSFAVNFGANAFPILMIEMR